MPATGGPHTLDVAIGQRIRERRRAMGLSQAALAEATGVTFQQIQKYERGTNRISFSRLAEVARALQCTLGDLAEDLVEVGASAELRKLNDLLSIEGALEILEAYADLPNRPLRRVVIRHVRALGEAGREDADGKR